jgi:hypothetical protein
MTFPIASIMGPPKFTHTTFFTVSTHSFVSCPPAHFSHLGISHLHTTATWA